MKSKTLSVAGVISIACIAIMGIIWLVLAAKDWYPPAETTLPETGEED